MRWLADIYRVAGRVLCVGILLVCCAGDALAFGSYTPFSGSSYTPSSRPAYQAESRRDSYSGRYSGLSGGRTTLDAGSQLFGGMPPSLVENPFREYEQRWSDDDPQRAPVTGGGTGTRPDPSTQLPIGDAVIPLLLMLAAYAAKLKLSKRKAR